MRIQKDEDMRRTGAWVRGERGFRTFIGPGKPTHNSIHHASLTIIQLYE